MPPAALVVLALLAVAAVLRARPAVALGVLLAAALLVPAPLVLPASPSPVLTVQHLLVVSGLARLVTGVAAGRVPRDVLRPTPAVAALVVVVLAAVVLGVALAPVPGPLGFAPFRLADQVDQLGFLVVVVALVRQLPDAHGAARVAAVCLGLAVAVAVLEEGTRQSFGHWLFSHLPEQAGTDAALPLSLRGGSVRVRAGAEFALQFGWLVATLLPVALAAAVRSRASRRVTPLVLAAGAAGVYWSFSRSALVGVVLAVVVLALLVRQTRTTVPAGGLVVAAALGYLAVPGVAARLSTATDQGAVDIRFQRLAPVLRAVSVHPYRGLGLGELVTSGYPTTDNALLLQYVELGTLGAALLVVLVAVALAQTARSLALRDPDDLLLGAACVVAVLVWVAGALSYDAFTLVQSTHVLWFVVAVGTVLAERALGPVPWPRPSPAFVVAAVNGSILAGALAVAVAPYHVASELVFTTLPAQRDAAGYDPVFGGTRLANTLCDTVRAAAGRLPTHDVQCELTAAAGAGRLRVQARDAHDVQQTYDEIVAVVRNGAGLRFDATYPLDVLERGRPTVLLTAPISLPVLVVGLVLLVPRRARPARPRPARVRPRPERGPAPPRPVLLHPGPHAAAGRPAGRPAPGARPPG